MTSDRDTILAQLAVEHGHVTQQQMDEAIEIQRKAREDLGLEQTLAQILESRRLVTAEQKRELESQVAIRTGDARLIGDHEVVSKIGAGGMGAVYEAVNRKTGQTVALKLLPPSLATADMIARFQRESAVAAKLNHDNIVRFVEFGHDESKQVWFCALELVEGEDLDKYLHRHGTVPEDETIRIARQIASALQHAHENGLVHRDIKPQNIMITPDGTAKLLDLGLARQAGNEGTKLTQSGHFVGSPYYASPEQATGEADIDIRSDIYGLGGTMYHMVTGKPPFSGASTAQLLYKHVHEKLTWPRDSNADLSDNICRVIAKMMAKAPRDRYQSPDELIAHLDLLRGGSNVEIDERVLHNSSIGNTKLQSATRVNPKVGPRAASSRPRHTSGRSRAVRESAPPSSRAMQFVGAGAALALAVVLLLVFAGGSSDSGKTIVKSRPPVSTSPAPTPAVETPPPPRSDIAPAPTDTSETATAKELAKIRVMIGLGLDNYSEVRAQLAYFPASHPDTPEARESKRLLDEFDARYAQQAEDALAAALASAREMTSKGEYDAALSAIRSVKSRFGEGPWLVSTGNAKIATAVTEVERKSRERSRSDASTTAPRAENRDRDEDAPGPADASGEAREMLATFDRLMDSGKHVIARDFANSKLESAGTESLKRLAASAANVAAVFPERIAAMKRGAKTLVGKDVQLRLKVSLMKGRVAEASDDGVVLATTYVINNQQRERTVNLKWEAFHPEQVNALAALSGWEAGEADLTIGEAYIALAAADYDAAEASLKAALSHPLHQHLKSRIREARTTLAFEQTMNRARALLVKKDWERAASEYERALELEPAEEEAVASLKMVRRQIRSMPFRDDFSRYADGDRGAPTWSTKTGKIEKGALLFSGDGRAHVVTREGKAVRLTVNVTATEKIGKGWSWCGLSAWSSDTAYVDAGLAQNPEGDFLLLINLMSNRAWYRSMTRSDWQIGTTYEVNMEVNPEGIVVSIAVPGQAAITELRMPFDEKRSPPPSCRPAVVSRGWEVSFDSFSATVTEPSDAQ